MAIVTRRAANSGVEPDEVLSARPTVRKSFEKPSQVWSK